MDGVIEQARADREEAQRELELARDEARAAIEDAERIKGRAELLVRQAHEIARESRRAVPRRRLLLVLTPGHWCFVESPGYERWFTSVRSGGWPGSRRARRAAALTAPGR